MPVTIRNRARYVLNDELFNEIMGLNRWHSSRDCARALNLHHSTIARLRAKETTPTYDVAMHMSERLGVRHDILFVPEVEEPAS